MSTDTPFGELDHPNSAEVVLLPSETKHPNHDFRKLVAHAKRKRYGHHTVRRCARCGVIEVKSSNGIQADYIWQNIGFPKPPDCDVHHVDILKQIGFTDNEILEEIYKNAASQIEAQKREAHKRAEKEGL